MRHQRIPGSSNSRNSSRRKRLQNSVGEQTIRVPRDRRGEFASPRLETTNEFAASPIKCAVAHFAN